MAVFPQTGDYKGYILDSDDVVKIFEGESVVNTKVIIKTVAKDENQIPIDQFHFGAHPEEWKNDRVGLLKRAKKQVDRRIEELAKVIVVVTPEEVDLDIAKIND